MYCKGLAIGPSNDDGSVGEAKLRETQADRTPALRQRGLVAQCECPSPGSQAVREGTVFHPQGHGLRKASHEELVYSSIEIVRTMTKGGSKSAVAHAQREADVFEIEDLLGGGWRAGEQKMEGGTTARTAAIGILKAYVLFTRPDTTPDHEDSLELRILAGLPTAVTPAGIDLTTTAPAPIVDCAPTGARITALVPIQQSAPIDTVSK